MHLRALEDEEIPRRDDNTLPKRSYHRYPFETLPQIKCHLRPEFVNFNTGKKLQDCTETSFEKLTEDFFSLKLIDGVYDAWKREIPPDAQKDESYNDPGYGEYHYGDDDDYDYDDIDDPKLKN